MPGGAGGVSRKKNKQGSSMITRQRTVQATTTNRLTKHDIQTVPKLDRYYAQEVQALIKKSDIFLSQQQPQPTMHKQQQEGMVQLAEALANADMMLQWGSIILSSTTTTSTDHYDNDDVRMAQDAYVTVLAILMQLTTGLRSRQNYTSPFLTKLAFSVEFVELLWRYCTVNVHRETSSSTSGKSSAYLRPSTYFAVSIFCDLFAHASIGTKDDTFIKCFTGFDKSSTIAALDVIVCVRELLYELYWSKPMKASDFQCIVPGRIVTDKMALIDSSRARLFLTGTKVWNSLFERWNRLVSRENNQKSPTGSDHVMCDVSTWWFPTMTSALAAGTSAVAVVSNGNDTADRNRPSRRNMNNSIGDNDDDDDGDDDAMSIDSSDSNNSSNSDGHSQSMAMMDDDPTSAAADAESDALAEAFSDPKMARILTCIPQAVPFDKRVKLFDSLLKADKRKAQVDDESTMQQAMLAVMRGDQDGDFMRHAGREQVEIRRDQLYDDSMRQLNSLGGSKKLKRRVQVSFINQHGTHEAGIDGGGVFKEFIDDLISDAFSVSATTTTNTSDTTEKKSRSTATYQLFAVTPLQTLKINTDLFHSRRHVEELLPHYEFLGRVLGKAVYESILVEPQFCLPFLNQLLGKSNSVEDLKNYDPEYYRNLMKLLLLSDVELESLGLTFELTLGAPSSKSTDSGLSPTSGPNHGTRTVELYPGGSQKPVSKENVLQYIHLIAHHRLNGETALPTRAFLRGFRDLIPASWVRLFSAYELQRLISGDDSIKGIDVQSFKNSMQYAAGYHPSQPVIEWFWEIVEEMTVDQQHKLLKFMTSCSRQPLLGFGSLAPAPCIQQIRLPDALFTANIETVAKQAPLPTSSTCMNLLKLPNYRWKELMRQKLLAAIESGAGFELT